MKKIPKSIAPIPSIVSAGRIVAVLGAIIPSASASAGVIDGRGVTDSPLEVRESGAPPRRAPAAPVGPAAIDANWRGLVESLGAMSVESVIVVSAVGAPAPGGADASAPA